MERVPETAWRTAVARLKAANKKGQHFDFEWVQVDNDELDALRDSAPGSVATRMTNALDEDGEMIVYPQAVDAENRVIATSHGHQPCPPCCPECP